MHLNRSVLIECLNRLLPIYQKKDPGNSGYILFDIHGDTVEMHCGSATMQGKMEMQSEGGKPPASFTVHGQRLRAILGELEGDTVELVVGKTNLKALGSGSRQFTMPVLDPSAYSYQLPAPADPSDSNATEVSAAELHSALKAVAHARGSVEELPHLFVVHIEKRKDQTGIAVATDGRRLATCVAPPIDIDMPGGLAALITQHFGELEDDAKLVIGQDDTSVTVTRGTTTLRALRPGGQFPQSWSMIDGFSWNGEATVQKSALVASLRAARLMVEGNEPALLQSAGNTLLVQVGGHTKGAAAYTDEVPVETPEGAGAIDAYVDVGFALEALAACADDMTLRNSQEALEIASNGFRSVIMKIMKK